MPETTDYLAQAKHYTEREGPWDYYDVLKGLRCVIQYLEQQTPSVAEDYTDVKVMAAWSRGYVAGKAANPPATVTGEEYDEGWCWHCHLYQSLPKQILCQSCFDQALKLLMEKIAQPVQENNPAPASGSQEQRPITEKATTDPVLDAVARGFTRLSTPPSQPHLGPQIEDVCTHVEPSSLCAHEWEKPWGFPAGSEEKLSWCPNCGALKQYGKIAVPAATTQPSPSLDASPVAGSGSLDPKTMRWRHD